MLTFSIFLLGFIVVFIINTSIKNYLKKKNPNLSEKDIQELLHPKASKVLLIGFIIMCGFVIYFNAFYESKSEILAREKNELEIKKRKEKIQALENEKQRLGLTNDEIEILNQKQMPIKNISDEVTNAYKILKSNDYFVDTEKIRFTGLAKKVKGTEFESRVNKTRDSIIKNEHAIAQKQMKAADKKMKEEEIAERKRFAEDFRNKLLDRGLNIKVSVSGPESKKMKLTYVLFTDVWFRKFETEGYFDQIHSKGFTHIELSDGYGYGKGVKYDN